MVSSVLVSVFFPMHLRPGDPIGWQGVMVQKNMLGEASTFAAIFFLVVTVKKVVHPALGSLLFVSSVVALIGSRSRTAEAVFVVSVVGIGLLVIRRPKGTSAPWIAAVLVVACAVVPFFIGPIAARLGYNKPLNGRTLLWSAALDMIKRRPLTGYGFSAVWGRGRATLLPQLPVTANRSATHAHNSIINIATELGVPAAMIECVFLIRALSNAMRLFDRESTAFALFAAGFVLAVVFEGFNENVMLQIHSLFWILLVALAVAVRRSEVAR
jgi:O-antigen ligase